MARISLPWLILVKRTLKNGYFLSFIHEPRAHFDKQSNPAQTNDHSGSVHNAGGLVLLDSVAIHRHNAECEVTTRKGSGYRHAARDIS